MTTVTVEDESSIIVNVFEGGALPGYFQEASTGGVSGVTDIDWTQSFHFIQEPPQGNLAYLFTDPESSCELTLLIRATDQAYSVTWNNRVVFNTPWAPETGSDALIRFYYDGNNYYASGENYAVL